MKIKVEFALDKSPSAWSHMLHCRHDLWVFRFLLFLDINLGT